MPPPLDKNLFTLTIEASKEETGATDLYDSDGVAVYRRRWGDSKEGSYAVNIFDALSDSLLATVAATNATSKNKTIELHNPTIKIDLTFTGRLSFKWEFKWEDHEFEWKKDECYLLRKPDPPVLVAVSESGRNKKSIVQFLDYNLSRFDIEDRRGLEVVLVASLLSFQDQSDEYRSRAAAGDATSGGLRAYSRQPSNSSVPAPVLPPKPGEALVVKLQSSHRHEPNEIVVGSEGAIDEYVDLACNLLHDESMMYIMIRALDPGQVPRVVQVAEETKRTRRRARYEEELHQYVRYEDEAEEIPKKPKVIKLDGSPPKEAPAKAYAPPKTLTIHLSKIPMPELMPLAPPPKPTNLSTKTSTLKVPYDSDSPSKRSASQSTSPAGQRTSIFGSMGGNSKNSSSGALNSSSSHPPRPGGVSAHNPYNPYTRPPRPVSPTLENATPGSQKLQKLKPSPGRASSDAVRPETMPGSYMHTPPQQWGANPAAPAPPSMHGQPSTIQDFVKDGVSTLGSSLLSKFSTRK